LITEIILSVEILVLSYLLKKIFKHKFYLPNKMVINYNQNSYQIKFWLLNNYIIKIMIEFRNQLSQNNLYLTLIIKMSITYIIRF